MWPRLNDARRVARIAMVLDEAVKRKEDGDRDTTIQENEFIMCGGRKSKIKKQYELYPHVLCAYRDFRCYLQKRKRFPAGCDVKKAAKLYVFWKSTYVKTSINCNEHDALQNIYLCLKEYRYSFLKDKTMCTKNIAKFNLACEDMKRYLQRSRFPPSVTVCKMHRDTDDLSSSENESVQGEENDSDEENTSSESESNEESECEIVD